MALARCYRLHRKDFERIYRQGKRRSGRYLRVIYLPPLDNSASDPPQVGIVVSKKVSKKAVHRNRIRRQVCAAFQALLPRIGQGWKIIITVNPSALGCTYGQLLSELETTLKKSEISADREIKGGGDSVQNADAPGSSRR